MLPTADRAYVEAMLGVSGAGVYERRRSCRLTEGHWSRYVASPLPQNLSTMNAEIYQVSQNSQRFECVHIMKHDSLKRDEQLINELEFAKKNFKLEKISLDNTQNWLLKDGVLQHATGGFFSVIGVNYLGSERVLLYQPQSAVTGLLTTKADGENWVLLQARAEPGNCGVAQYGPTIQSTQANSFGFHGGRPAPYVNHFLCYNSQVKAILHDSEQVDLGERYFFKTKRLAVLEVHSKFEPAEGFHWVSTNSLVDHVQRSFFLNTDLRSLLSVFHWAGQEGGISFIPKSHLVRRSLGSRIRQQVIGEVCNKFDVTSDTPRIQPLESLKSWVLTEEGFFEKEPRQNFSVEFFRVSLTGREVKEWCQPLINSAGPGKVILLCRVKDDALELGLRIAQEIGLKPRACLQATFVVYPGDEDAISAYPGAVLCSTTESDEGGRFFNDASSYQLRLVDSDSENTDGLIWLNLSEIRWFLVHSNFCAIQLRGILSFLLGDLPGMD